MNILTLNVGSSSVKYKLFKDSTLLLEQNIQNIRTAEERKKIVQDLAKTIQLQDIKVQAIAHRVVHGDNIKQTTKITPTLIKKLKKIADLAPLHNIPEIEVIEFALKKFDVPQFAVFDTAFHQTMPEKTKTYPIPYELTQKGIHKYGFHGISHKYISKGLKGKVITCHLGAGASLAAIKNGVCQDTTMGFTPLDGLMMATRSGSVDPSIIPYLRKHEKLSTEQINEMLNKKSGLLGVSGISGDPRDLYNKKTPRAQLALDMYANRIAKYIGALAATLNGVDTLVFSAGVGEGSWQVRQMVCKQLTHLGVKLDTKNNRKHKKNLHTRSSKVKILIVPTNEELAMAQEVLALL